MRKWFPLRDLGYNIYKPDRSLEVQQKNKGITYMIDIDSIISNNSYSLQHDDKPLQSIAVDDIAQVYITNSINENK